MLNKIKQLINENFEITLNNESYSISFFNWDSIIEQHQKLVEKTAKLSNEEASNFWSHTKSSYINICDYFLYDEATEMNVDDNLWLPFAVLNMSYLEIEECQFAEENNNGILFFDLSCSEIESAPILYLYDDEWEIIAKNFEEFKKLLS